jgi:pyridoxamine 5'-phosphate oxidase
MSTGQEASDDGLYLEAIALLKAWYLQAAGREELAEAAALATVAPDGSPDVRMVLIKAIEHQGLAFYTNCTSVKGQALAHDPRCAVVFHWKSLHRQVRVAGTTVRLDDLECDRYFASRPRLSQLAAWASEQSQPLDDRGLLEARLEEYGRRFADREVPRPPHWVGYQLVPQRLEFWQEEPGRLHRRQLFHREGPCWMSTLLQP